MTDLAAWPSLDATGDRPGLTAAQLRRVKPTYTTRHVWRFLAGLNGTGCRLTSQATPRPGDVLLAQVQTIGRHKRLETPDSRRALLFPGDRVLVAYGHRYAPDQFEAEVPPDLRDTHLVAAGGVAGTVTAAHVGLEPPTEFRPLGLLTCTTEVLNLRHAAPLRIREGGRRSLPTPRVVAFVGTSMNSGKSTALASLAHGLTAAGLAVAAGKVTGTGAGGDVRMYADGGAHPVIDFTDFGYASTYKLDGQSVRCLFTSLLDELAGCGADVILVEIADGICQPETAHLLAEGAFAAQVDRIVFTAADALGAHAGVQMLSSLGLATATVSGRLTASPLATREAQSLLPVKIRRTESLCEPDTALAVLHDTA